LKSHTLAIADRLDGVPVAVGLVLDIGANDETLNNGNIANEA